MKSRLIILILIFILLNGGKCYAQLPNDLQIVIDKTYGGPENDGGFVVRPTSDGGFLIGGNNLE